MIKKFPKVTDADIAFGGYPEKWFKSTLAKAEIEGFDTNGSSRAAELFHNGGKLNLNKSLDDGYLDNGVRMLKAILGSFNPKHEHKMSVCSYILASIENK